MNRTRSAKTGRAACGVYRSRVEWLDTDASGHHHNTAIARFVEAAEAVLMRERGLREYTRVAPRVVPPGRRESVPWPTAWLGTR